MSLSKGSGWKYSLDADTIPRYALYLFADILEILCCLEESRRRSIRSLQDEELIIEDESEDGAGFDTNGGEEATGEGEPDSENEVNIPESIEYDIEQVILARETHLGASYPFERVVENGKVYVRLRQGLTRQQQFYVFLLFAANSRLFECTDTSRALRNDFEVMSAFAMQTLVPLNTVVKLFGTARPGYTRHQKLFGSFDGSLREKVQSLAAALGVPESSDVPHLQGNGDGGVDIVGLVNLDSDAGRKHPVFLGQAGATYSYKEINDKMGELISFHDLIPRAYPIFYFFSPVSYRDSNWKMPVARSWRITVPLIDRSRMLNLIIESKPKANWTKSWRETTSARAIQELLKRKSAVFICE